MQIFLSSFINVAVIYHLYYQSIHLSFIYYHLSMYLPIIYLLPTNLPIIPSVRLSVRQSVRPSIHPSVHPSMYLSVGPKCGKRWNVGCPLAPRWSTGTSTDCRLGTC